MPEDMDSLSTGMPVPGGEQGTGSQDAASDDPMVDYQMKVDLQESEKRMGIEAYADMMIGLLGDKVNPDQAILAKRGMIEMLAPRPIPFPPSSSVPSAPVQITTIRSSVFVHRTEDYETVYDWYSLVARATHSTHWLNKNTVTLYDGAAVLLELEGPAAEDFLAYCAELRDQLIPRSNPLPSSRLNVRRHREVNHET